MLVRHVAGLPRSCGDAFLFDRPVDAEAAGVQVGLLREEKEHYRVVFQAEVRAELTGALMLGEAVGDQQTAYEEPCWRPKGLFSSPRSPRASNRMRRGSRDYFYENGIRGERPRSRREPSACVNEIDCSVQELGGCLPVDFDEGFIVGLLATFEGGSEVSIETFVQFAGLDEVLPKSGQQSVM